MTKVLTLAAMLVGLAVATADARAACPRLLDRELMSLQGQPVSLCKFGGKVLLVVNTASQCGYTPQYEGLEKLYQRYRERGLVVLGFPANDFGAQEPGTNEQIAQFCEVNYGVSFPMFAKTSVIGANANPLYRDLASRTGQQPQWNFYKYLLDRNGRPVVSFGSAVDPSDPRLTSQIEQFLAR